ncbi:MAG: efflux RND transporter permease subunit [Alphaproteobacteria bacterium]|nr:efflux RND transporter permease subunit [Alphaproteobacteria bacterium]MDE2014447.1 efflux RND transporter permease subunit [Alphaproteobacteria bacterium]MDE2350824.1 efflux RND transporter permease subunit [Alphaproteobacteria bacterium]
MTRIIDWAVRNTRVVLAMLVVVVVAGTIAFIRIPKEADPDIPIPVISVQIAYPGISPEDSARLLVKPMERYLRSIEGLKTITARAYQGMAVIILEFDVNFDKEKALEDVRAQVETARAELPQDAKQPLVQEFNTSLFPVITVALSGQVPERTLLSLARNLRDDLKTIPSVLDADLSGDRQEMLEIVVDPTKLDSFGITQQELYNAITNNNRLIAAGSIDTGHGSFAVKVPGVIETAADVLNLPIRSTADATVTLGDVAQVHRTFYDATTYARMNGQPTIALDVTKRIGANIIQNNADVRDMVAKVSKNWPPGVHVSYMFDESTSIRDQLGSLSDSIILAIVLVMIIVVAALGLRSGLLVGVAIPTSFLMSFMIMNGTGMTVNFMIMFAMLLAVGILVDGAIIVVEYADRKMTEGLPPREAFADAARRMFWPVVSATATMIGAFLPMLLWPGVPGKFMSFFPITLIIVLGSSMVVALIFLPVLGGFFGKAPPRDEQHERAIEASETGDWRDIPGITGWYAHLAARLVRHPGKVIAGAFGVVVVVVSLFVIFNHGVEFFVTTDPEEATILVSARGNLSADEKRDIVMGVEHIVARSKGIKSIYAVSGGSNFSLNSQGGVPVDNIGRIIIELKNYRERRPGEEIMNEIRRNTAHIPGVHVEVREPQSGPSGGKDVMIDVASDNPADLASATALIRNHLDGMKTLRDIEDTRPLPGIEWDLKINRDLASRFGVSAQSIGTAVQLVTDGILVGQYRPDDADNEVDIRVRYPSHARGIHALDDLRVATTSGMVPLSNFVRRVPAQQVTSIERIDGHQVYHVRANVKAGLNADAEVAKIKTWLAAQTLARDVHVKFTGADQDQNESGAFLVEAGFMALFLIGIVLLTLFNSFYHTSLILIAVVLAMIGALLGMVVMGQSFSIIMTGTGMLALAGIVVNHNIVLIDTFHRLLASGMEPIEAVIRSSAQRLRPVFLTTVTAIGGLLPMMFAIEINFATREVTIGGPNGMMWVQLSTAIVFGLAFSKMITLGLVPAMLALPHVKRQTGQGFLWFLGLVFGAPLRWTKRRIGRLTGREPETQAAE